MLVAQAADAGAVDQPLFFAVVQDALGLLAQAG